MTDEPHVPMEDPDVDRQIEAEVARTVGPWEGVYPAEVLDEMRRLLRFGLRNLPATQALMRQLRADLSVQRSDKVDVRSFAFKRPKQGGET